MHTRTIIVGGLITLTGSGAFLLSEDLLALAPAGLGLVLMALGTLARAPQRQALMGHLAVFTSFSGMVFCASAMQRVIGLISGDTVERSAAVVSVAITALLCLVHVTMSVRWFLARRRSQSA